MQFVDEVVLPNAPCLWTFFLRPSAWQDLHSSWFKYFTLPQVWPVHWENSLLTSIPQFDIIKRNREAFWKGQIQAEILILGNVKASKFNTFLDCAHGLLPEPPPPPEPHHSFTHLFLINIIFSYFERWIPAPTFSVVGQALNRHRVMRDRANHLQLFGARLYAGIAFRSQRPLNKLQFRNAIVFYFVSTYLRHSHNSCIMSIFTRFHCVPRNHCSA